MLDAAQRAALRPRVVAHRGRHGDLPEHCLASLARLPDWIRRVEIDVRLSRDGVPVLMHDKTVDRTTDGRGSVVDHSVAELEALTLLPDSRVARLEAYLEACRARALEEVWLHVKVRREEALAATLATVRAVGMQDRCVLLFRSGARALRAHTVARDLRIGLLATCRDNVAERVTLARFGVVSLLATPAGDAGYLSERGVVAAARAAGVRVGASTLCGEIAHQAALHDGCDFVVSDSVHRLDAGADADALR